MKLIYILDVVVISILLFLIVSSMMASKHYMDESMNKGLVERLQYMLHSLIELLKSMILILFLAVYISLRIHVCDRGERHSKYIRWFNSQVVLVDKRCLVGELESY